MNLTFEHLVHVGMLFGLALPPVLIAVVCSFGFLLYKLRLYCVKTTGYGHSEHVPANLTSIDAITDFSSVVRTEGCAHNVVVQDDAGDNTFDENIYTTIDDGSQIDTVEPFGVIGSRPWVMTSFTERETTISNEASLNASFENYGGSSRHRITVENEVFTSVYTAGTSYSSLDETSSINSYTALGPAAVTDDTVGLENGLVYPGTKRHPIDAETEFVTSAETPNYCSVGERSPPNCYTTVGSAEAIDDNASRDNNGLVQGGTLRQAVDVQTEIVTSTYDNNTTGASDSLLSESSPPSFYTTELTVAAATADPSECLNQLPSDSSPVASPCSAVGPALSVQSSYL